MPSTLSTSYTYSALQAAAFLFFSILIAQQLLGANPFPFADEWSLLPYALGDESLSWEWLWHQHVDHRIPIQKTLQVYLLRFSSADFRILVLFNAILAYLVTVFLLHVVRTYRGRAHFGDLLFPVLLLNPGFGPFTWGFHLQFASSVFLVLCCVAFLLQRPPLDRVWRLVAALLALTLLALCGMNGAILAAVFAVSVLAYAYKGERPAPPVSEILRSKTGLFLLPLTIATIIFLAWDPGQTGQQTGHESNIWALARQTAQNWLVMLSPRSWYLPPLPSLYYLVNLTLYVAALALLLQQLRLASLSCAGIHARAASAGAMLGVLAVLSVIAIARANYWTPGLELHYGYLAVPLPIVAWIVLSTASGGGKTAALVAFALLPLYGSMYARNILLADTMRLNYKRPAILQIFHDANKSMGVREFVANNVLSFYHIDSDEIRKALEQDIEQLQSAGIPPFTHLKP
jgi:hypothetical protein